MYALRSAELVLLLQQLLGEAQLRFLRFAELLPCPRQRRLQCNNLQWGMACCARVLPCCCAHMSHLGTWRCRGLDSLQLRARLVVFQSQFV